MIFVVDYSVNHDEHVFNVQQNFIKDLVDSMKANIGKTRVRVGYVYVTVSSSQQFGLTGFETYKDVIAAVGRSAE